MSVLTGVALAGAVALGAQACGAAVIVESGSASIRSDQPEGGRDASVGADVLFARRGEEGAVRQVLLWQFDVSPYEGLAVTGACMFTVGVSWAGHEAPFTLHEVRAPWRAESVTWNGLAGINGDHADVLGPALDTRIVGPVQGQVVVYGWQVPADAVRRWLEQPREFHGLALVAQADYVAHHFVTRAGGNRALAGTLNVALAGEERLAARAAEAVRRVSAQGGVCETMSARIGADRPDANESSADTGVSMMTLLRGRADATPHAVLWRFDLSRYKGRRVEGDAYVSCGLIWSEYESDFALYEMLADWHETNVTWR